MARNASIVYRYRVANIVAWLSHFHWDYNQSRRDKMIYDMLLQFLLDMFEISVRAIFLEVSESFTAEWTPL